MSGSAKVETSHSAPMQSARDVLARIREDLAAYYVFPETAEKLARAIDDATERLVALATEEEFVGQTNTLLYEIAKDKHLRLIFNKEPRVIRRADEAPHRDEHEERLETLRRTNFGFERVERRAGNIGLLVIREFAPPEMGAETAVAAMNFLANTDGLLIDLRHNRGGNPWMVALLTSYLFAQPVHLNSLYWRPTDRTDQYWTLPYVPGKRYVGKPVGLLVSRHTFSGAEEFAYNLKTLGRARLYGERTAGGGNIGKRVQVAEHFSLFIPIGHAINPVTLTNWEGTGVEPHVICESAQALKRAEHDLLHELLRKGPAAAARTEIEHALAQLKTTSS